MGILNSILGVLSGGRMAPNLKTTQSTVTESAVGDTSREGDKLNCHESSNPGNPISTLKKLQQCPAASNDLIHDMSNSIMHSSPLPPSSSTQTYSLSTPSQFTFGTPSDTIEIDRNKQQLGSNIIIPIDCGATSRTVAATISTATTATTTTTVTTEPKCFAQTRPNKRRQEEDTTSEVESIVTALDIDTASLKPDNQLIFNAGLNSENHPDNSQKYKLVQNRMFDIPEIIRSIGEFLDMPSLAACCLVSRIWVTHCTPLMWKHVIDKHWLDGRFYALVKSKAPFIQTIKCKDKTDYEELLLCELPRLKALTFQGSRENMAVKVKIINKVRNTLTSLVLRNVGDDYHRDTVIAIRNLKRLTTLKIQSASFQANQLEDILSDCSSIEFLSLSSVGLTIRIPPNSVDGFIVDDDDNIEPAPEMIDNASHQIPITKIRYLALKDMSAPVSYISKIIKSCPQLLELSLAANENMSFSSDFFQSMKTHCPALYALDVGSCKKMDRDEFSTLFTTITQLTIINLSGTRVSDKGLLLLAENCLGLRRLDIEYCTSITSLGIHKFLCNSGPSLRHLEASGVTLQPELFDDNHWKCSNLQILFVHIGLICPPPSPVSSTSDSVKMNAGNNISSESTDGSTALTGVENDRKRSQDEVVSPQSSPLDSNLRTDANQTSSSTQKGCESLPSLIIEADGDIVMKHPLHPIQKVTNVQYLGLMGSGPSLVHSSQNLLFNGFRSIKRLNLMGLYQCFKKDDVVWYIENLPDLCRIDAEKYIISDDLVKWVGKEYPHIQICRQE